MSLFCLITEVGVEAWGQCLDKEQSEYQKQGCRLRVVGPASARTGFNAVQHWLSPKAGALRAHGEEGGR